MQVLEYRVQRNPPLHDGTPRRETGYRKFVTLSHRGRKIATSRLFPTEAEANLWWPPYRSYH